jgi:hypothetical protein
MMGQTYKDFLIGVAFLIGGLFFLVVIVPVEIRAVGEYSFGLPPDFFPKVIGWIIVVLAAVLIGQSVLKDRNLLRTLSGEILRCLKTADVLVIRNVIVVFAACLLYYFLLQVLPFFVISPVYSVLLGLFLAIKSKTPAKRRILLVLTTAVMTTAIIFFAFEKLLHVQLP